MALVCIDKAKAKKKKKKRKKDKLKCRAKLARIYSDSTLVLFHLTNLLVSKSKEKVSKSKVNIYGYMFS